MSAIQSGRVAQGREDGSATAESTHTRGWLGRFFDRMEEQWYEREREEMDAYLGEATDLADLEQRMRKWDRGLVQKRYRSLGF